MGVVYRARHETSEHAVALKTVSATAPLWIDGIRREIAALTRIRHPGVVRIVDHGVHNGIPWYAMDLLEGESLRHFGQRIWSRFRVPQGQPVASTEQIIDVSEYSIRSLSKDSLVPSPLRSLTGTPPAAAGELRAVLRIVRRICATLAFLHGEGFVNCDLKPENILLVNSDPILIDFGLMAQHPGRTGREAITAHHAMSGTYPYMSPEQIRGELVDARSDLYSLGCMLYELVAGVPPFLGTPKAVLHSHLVNSAAAPSTFVADVPPALERLILKLLEKRLDQRFGYADEVGTLLAEIGEDVDRLANFPPPRSYLYRPRFVGRDEFLKHLAGHRDQASDGTGGLVLIGGESGAGKTRVAMELTRTASPLRIQTVTSEASPLSSERQGTVAATPLHALRPLLRAVADCCQHGGPETTERLLGEARAVLSVYEPLLTQVPANDDTPAPPIALSAEASRQRLFSCLRSVLRAFALERPLSLSFLHSLSAEYLQSVPALIVCAYRTEEVTDVVASLAALPHVEHFTLPRLGREAVASIISDALGTTESDEAFVEFVMNQSEGNPFFVGEYLRTAVAERAIYRDGHHAWRLVGQSQDPKAQYRSLPLPGSLRDLIEQRIRSISPAGQQLALAAAVLGREADTDVIRAVSALSEDAVLAAIDELLRRQVLEQTDRHLRFAHDKLREVVYGRAAAERLVPLHSSAADVLERRVADGSDSHQRWASLGHHFALARRREQAAKYLKLAADHARATYANGAAIRLYGDAIQQAREMLASDSDTVDPSRATLAELYEAMADVLVLGGDREAARAAYQAASSNVPSLVRTSRSRLSRKIGKSWDMQLRPEDALRSYANALSILEEMGDPARAQSPETVREWIQVQIDRMWVYYYSSHLPDMQATIEALAPVIEARGSAAQRALFFRNRTLLNFRRHLYVISEETVRFAKIAVDACREDPTSPDLPLTLFMYGFTLVFQHSLDDGQRELDAALALAKRAGDGSVQARTLAYLTLVARMRGDVAGASALAERCDAVAHEVGAQEYVAAAAAHKAWLLLQRGALDAAEREGLSALERWTSLSALFPFHWMAILPLVETALARDDVARASELASGLLAPGQQYLPGFASDSFARAVGRWRSGDTEGARTALAQALRHLDGTGYR
jgi:serine/threonine protein kinase/tetratricopeptide (TPR) repeat protein